MAKYVIFNEREEMAGNQWQSLVEKWNKSNILSWKKANPLSIRKLSKMAKYKAMKRM
jgi:hypothetical protein